MRYGDVLAVAEGDGRVGVADNGARGAEQDATLVASVVAAGRIEGRCTARFTEPQMDQRRRLVELGRVILRQAEDHRIQPVVHRDRHDFAVAVAGGIGDLDGHVVRRVRLVVEQ